MGIIVRAVLAYGTKERNSKYTIDGLLHSVLKMVMVTVIVSQKGAGIFNTIHGYYSGSKKCPNVCMFFTKVDNP